MGGTFLMISEAIGIPPVVLAIFIIWSLTWKLLALWKSARKRSIIWFIVLALVNTLGVLEILYIFLFSKMNLNSRKKTKKTIPKKKAAKRKK